MNIDVNQHLITEINRLRDLLDQHGHCTDCGAHITECKPDPDSGYDDRPCCRDCTHLD